MIARYILDVGPANRNRDYANRVTVLADSYGSARDKAVVLRGYSVRNSSVWLVRIDEIDPNMELLEQLAKLIKDKDNA